MILWEDFSFCCFQCHRFPLFPLCCQHGLPCKWRWKDAQIVAGKAAWLTVVLGLLTRVRHCEYLDSSPLGLVHGSAHGGLASSRSSELGWEQGEPRLLKDHQFAELQRWLYTPPRSPPQSPLSTHCSATSGHLKVSCFWAVLTLSEATAPRCFTHKPWNAGRG